MAASPSCSSDISIDFKATKRPRQWGNFGINVDYKRVIKRAQNLAKVDVESSNFFTRSIFLYFYIQLLPLITNELGAVCIMVVSTFWLTLSHPSDTH